LIASTIIRVRLLRVAGTRRPVGAAHDVEVDARIIAATNRDVGPMVKDRDRGHEAEDRARGDASDSARRGTLTS
jgi:transcriptional regulator of aromatic amino acid metabolism